LYPIIHIFLKIQKDIDDIRFNLADEKLQECNGIEKGWVKLRRRDRISKKSEKYPKWRFDFTKSFYSNNKRFSGIKPEFSFEVEWRGTVAPTTDELKEMFLFLKKYELLDTIVKKLNLRGNPTSLIEISNNPISLTKNDIKKIENYSVSEKADGVRCFLYYDKKNTYEILKPWDITIVDTKGIKNSLIDCEKVEDRYYKFDLLIYDNRSVINESFRKRYELLLGNFIDVKKFYFDGDIYKKAEEIWKEKHPYHIDGLIFTPDKPYNNMIVYKWKPPRELTIDFLIKKIDKDNMGLFVNYSADLMKQMNIKPNLNLFSHIKPNNKNFPYYFTPSPIIPNNPELKDDTIVEMYWENGWHKLRIREDKTKGFRDNLEKGIYEANTGPNGYKTAMNIWKLIQNPVTENDLFIGDKYYKNIKVKKDKWNIYKFNNFVKRKLYEKYTKKGGSILELAGGRGGDLGKIAKTGVKFVLLTNINKEALEEANRRGKKYNFNLKLMKLDLTDLKSFELLKEKYGDLQFDLISCNFAIHYFLGTKEVIDNLHKIINYFLKKGGYFLFTGYDGKKVYELLQNNNKIKYSNFAQINRLYDNREFMDYGQKINVYVEKIGVKHPEYLINFGFMKKIFEGYNVVKNGYFDEFIKDFDKSECLTDDEIEYAKIHRFIVFKKIL